MVPAACLKIERAAQGNHELAGGRVMPIERAARNSLLEGNGRHRQFAGEDIAMRAAFEIDNALRKMRAVVVPGPKAHAANHPGLLMPFAGYLLSSPLTLSPGRYPIATITQLR